MSGMYCSWTRINWGFSQEIQNRNIYIEHTAKHTTLCVYIYVIYECHVYKKPAAQSNVYN